jgi:hypothetical protein
VQNHYNAFACLRQVSVTCRYLSTLILCEQPHSFLFEVLHTRHCWNQIAYIHVPDNYQVNPHIFLSFIFWNQVCLYSSMFIIDFWWDFSPFNLMMLLKWKLSIKICIQNMKIENIGHLSIFLVHFSIFYFILFYFWHLVIFPQKIGNFKQNFIFKNIFQRMKKIHYQKKSLGDFTFNNVIFEQIFSFILQCFIFVFVL